MENELDYGLNVLLDLDGYEGTLEDGLHTVRFQVSLVDATENVPHGIRYNLTLHDETGRRILGYDNRNHDYRSESKKGYVARKTEWDHRHRKETVTGYEFQSPVALLEDFWRDVYGFLGKGGRSYELF